MGRQSDVEKIHVEIKYLKLDFCHSSYSSFSSPSLFFSSVFSGFFFCKFLSFLCLGSFLFLQVPFFFFTMGFFLLHVLSGQFFSFVFSGFFFCRSLSLVYLGSFLFLQIPFFFFTMDFFLLRVLSILVGIVLLLPLWVTSSSFLLQFQTFFNSSNSCSYSMKLESLRLEFHVAKIFPCQQSISSLWDSISYRTRDANFLHTFKTLLTNDIIFLHYANLQISPNVSSILYIFRILQIYNPLIPFFLFLSFE